MKQFKDILPYLESIRSLPRLDPLDLTRTLDLYRLTKSISARNRLVEHYLPLIPQIIDRYIGQGIDLDDLIQESNCKLIEVLERLSTTDEVIDIKAFIVKSISNRIIDLLRQSQRQ